MLFFQVAEVVGKIAADSAETKASVAKADSEAIPHSVEINDNVVAPIETREKTTEISLTTTHFDLIYEFWVLQLIR